MIFEVPHPDRSAFRNVGFRGGRGGQFPVIPFFESWRYTPRTCDRGAIAPELYEAVYGPTPESICSRAVFVLNREHRSPGMVIGENHFDC